MFASYQQTEYLPSEPIPYERYETPERRSLSTYIRPLLCISGSVLVIVIVGLSLSSSPSNNSIQVQSLHANQEISFGRLAEERLKESGVWESFESQLDTLAPGCSPMSIHKLRINTGRLRDFLDIFGPAYPPKKHDAWKLMRDDFAEGYQTLGEFQDIVQRGAQPNTTGFTFKDKLDYNNVIDPHEVTKWRDRSLHWKESHLALDHKVKMKHYLEHPSHSKIFFGSRSFSRFFWGDIKAFDVERPGMYWIGVLLRNKLKYFDTQASCVMNLTTIKDLKSHTTFHEFRKNARSLVAIERIFPDAFHSGADFQLGLLKTTFHDAGKVNNVYNLHQHVEAIETKKTHSELKNIEKVLDSLLKDFQKWADKNSITTLGERLTAQLVNTGRD